MNQFGQLLRVSIFGESHGPAVGITVDGLPPGMPVEASLFLHDLERRKGGTQKGTTPRQEDDIPEFVSGVFEGRTTGAPLTMIFANKNTRSGDYAKQRDIPRPGHADWVANSKFFGFEDFRGGGHFSGRLTVCLVAAGVLAKQLLREISINATITEVGGEPGIDAGLQKAIEQKDSVGGIVECRVTNVPAGLGEPFFNSVESLLAHAVFSIPAIKGIEFGAGFAAATMFGAQHNDAIISRQGATSTNHAGGIVGGITNGNELVFRVVVKPTSSTPKEQTTLNWNTGEQDVLSVKGRHDLCIALRVPPVLEAVTALVLADLFLQRKAQTSFLHTAPLLHVIPLAHWEQSKSVGYITAESLKSEGFIHCCQPHQLAGVLQRHFTGQEKLVAVHLDAGKISAPVRYESAANLQEKFPHVYGTIEVSAVTAVTAL